MTTPFVVRSAGRGDAHILVELFDAAVLWLVQQGFTEQWGTKPFSEVPERVRTCEKWAAGGFFVCEVAGRPTAALVLGEAPDYVAPADEAEVYVVVLVGSHEPFAHGSGRHLLSVADQEARRLGVRKLRVDCFAGNGGALVRFYEGCGYRRTDTFQVGPWAGQILERILRPEHPGTTDPRFDQS